MVLLSSFIALTSLAALAQAQAQAQQPNTDNKAASLPAGAASKLPKLDAKAVSQANQQQQDAGINELCAQSLSRVAGKLSSVVPVLD